MSENAANLRLPVPFFDLLMVLLVTCLVFVAPVRPDGETKPAALDAMDVAVSQNKTAAAPGTLLPVIPKHDASGWTFAIADGGQVVTATELARRAHAENRKIALVVPPTTAVQDFVDMQATLAALNIPFALAIKSKEATP